MCSKFLLGNELVFLFWGKEDTLPLLIPPELNKLSLAN
jgi:hypothetical protein